MTWHRSDDGFPEHPKSDALAEHFGDDWATCAVAFMTWHHMGCDCASRRTDGVFNAARAHRVIRAPREVIDRALAGLLKVGFLDKHRDGFAFHDWAEYQPTRAELDLERAQKTARQARWRAGKASKVDGGETPKETASSARVDGVVDASTTASVDGGVEGAPSRPDPTRPEGRETRASARGEPPPPRPPLRQPPPPARPTPWLDALNRAARGHVILAGVAKLEADLDDLLARYDLSDEVVAAMGAAFADVSKWWPGQRPKTKRPTLNDLAGFDPGGGAQWKPLAALVAHAQEVVASAQRGAPRRPAAAPLASAPPSRAPLHPPPAVDLAAVLRNTPKETPTP